jgi:hypothetical protein
MFNQDEFLKYAVKHRGISSATLHNYTSITADYISPTIIEERQLNVAQMDVFSRLMMDQHHFPRCWNQRLCGQHRASATPILRKC